MWLEELLDTRFLSKLLNIWWHFVISIEGALRPMITNPIHSDYILTSFWLHSDWIMATFWLYSGYILATFWLHSDHILITFWLHSDYILTIFWTYSGYILTTFWHHELFIVPDDHWSKKIFRLFETVKKGGRVQKRPKKLLPTRKHNSDTFEVSPVKAKSRKGLVLYSTLSQLLPTELVMSKPCWQCQCRWQSKTKCQKIKQCFFSTMWISNIG